MLRIALTVLLLSAIQTAPGSFEGIVIDKATNQPIEDARVTLERVGSGNAEPAERQSIPAIVTGPDGKFAFRGVVPGNYRISIASNGYVRQMFGAKTVSSRGTVLELTAGQQVKDLSLRLIATGSIAGRVFDSETQQPLVGVPVQLVRYRYRDDGTRYLHQAITERTDDRGRYRLHSLTPGGYYVRAGDTPYVPAFYPGAATAKNAVLVEVKAGADFTGIDMNLGKSPVYNIRGRVVDSSTGKPPIFQPVNFSPRISLYRESDTGWEYLRETNDFSDPAAFSFRGIHPGSYRLVAQPRRTSSTGPASPTRPPTFAATVIPIEIEKDDIENLVVSMSIGINVAGKIQIEGQRTYLSMEGSIQVIGSDGLFTKFVFPQEESFSVDGLSPGDYRVKIPYGTPGLFVKEAKLGPFDALRGAVTITGGSPVGFNVVLSSNVGTVEGMVTAARPDVAAFSDVVLVPDRDRDRPDLFYSVTADRDGRFSFPSVAPGGYKLFAWEGIEEYAYFDSELLARVGQRGKAVQVSESSKQNVSVTVIPADN